MDNMTARAIFSKGVGGIKFWQKIQLSKHGHCIPQPLIDDFWQHTEWELCLGKDVNDEYVFEGDIVDIVDENGRVLHNNKQIKFDKKMYAFVIDIDSEKYPLMNFTKIGFKMKVNGNIHNLN